MDLKNLDFKQNRSYIKAARAAHWLLLPWLRFVLYFLVLLGLILFQIAFKTEGANIPAGTIALALFLLMLLKFSASYFRKLELKNVYKPSTGKNVSIFECTDFEAATILGDLNANNPDLKKLFRRILCTVKVNFISDKLNISHKDLASLEEHILFSNNIEGLNLILSSTLKEMFSNGECYLSSANLFYGFIANLPNRELFLADLELSLEDIGNLCFWSNVNFDKKRKEPTLIERLKVSKGGLGKNWVFGYTPFLDKYGEEITDSRRFQSVSMEGREDTLEKVGTILSRENKNSCLIIGPMGGGKSSLVTALAEKIYYGKSQKEIAHKRVISLNLDKITIDSFIKTKEILVQIFEEAAQAGNVIILIEDIERFFNGNSQNTEGGFFQIFASFLTRPEFRIVGTTTNNDYQTYIAPYPALFVNFEVVPMPPANFKETIRVMEDLAPHFEKKYNSVITYSALTQIYKVADKFISVKEFPGKALTLMDSVCFAAHARGEKLLNKDLTNQLSESILNIPISSFNASEKEKLLHLEEIIHTRVIGQEEAISAVADALRRARTQIKETNKPLGSFLFLGPTGVGKTESAKALAWSYFGSESNMVRLDMSEYQTRESANRLLGYKNINSSELVEGNFVKAIRQTPFCVVLLDEIEKAHSDILNLFLQVLDEGYLTDGLGNKVNFSQTIIIGTSNAGANLIREEVIKGTAMEQLSNQLLDYLQKENIYRPEFLNRFDGVIVFKPLTPEQILKIADLMFKKIQSQMKLKGYIIYLGEGVIQKLAELGYQPELGARPMNRVFQDKIESLLALKILNGSLLKGVPLTINLKEII
ncbi:MAG: AAA family ATPase [Candidatus Parcubacteria bacterium]|nr:AAA family ATPase [Candidatus Parcubacteria bacterium]